jgi:hypothetical protein
MLSVYIILPVALSTGVYSASNRNDYRRQKLVLGNRARLVREANGLTTIVEPIEEWCLLGCYAVWLL